MFRTTWHDLCLNLKKVWYSHIHIIHTYMCLFTMSVLIHLPRNNVITNIKPKHRSKYLYKMQQKLQNIRNFQSTAEIWLIEWYSHNKYVLHLLEKSFAELGSNSDLDVSVMNLFNCTQLFQKSFKIRKCCSSKMGTYW